MALVAESRSEMQHMVKALDKACERWGMHISVDKTKILAVAEQEPDHSPFEYGAQKDMAGSLWLKETGQNEEETTHLAQRKIGV